MEFKDIFRQMLDPTIKLSDVVKGVKPKSSSNTMFKVSFKETKDNPSKIVTKIGSLTTVTLKGVVQIPSVWYIIPKDVFQWIESQRNIELYEDTENKTLTIYSEGASRCHDNDKFDSVLGERIAEARAKQDIYKFFYKLSEKLLDYFLDIAGNCQINDNTTDRGLVKEMNKYKQLYHRELNHVTELLIEHHYE